MGKAIERPEAPVISLADLMAMTARLTEALEFLHPVRGAAVGEAIDRVARVNGELKGLVKAGQSIQVIPELVAAMVHQALDKAFWHGKGDANCLKDVEAYRAEVKRLLREACLPQLKPALPPAELGDRFPTLARFEDGTLLVKLYTSTGDRWYMSQDDGHTWYQTVPHELDGEPRARPEGGERT